MKVLGIQTSPNADGLTATMCKAVLEGAAAAGAETDLIHLRKLDIRACLACEDGWGICRSEARCIIEDEFQGVRERIGEADAVVVSTPVYFGEVSEVTKSLFDRLRRCEVTLTDDSPIRGTPAVGISAAGGSGGGAVSALAMLERYFQFVGLLPFDLITVTRRSRPYRLPMAEKAGRSLVEFVASGGE
jgi:multimeric flavodoxin WrbA